MATFVLQEQEYKMKQLNNRQILLAVKTLISILCLLLLTVPYSLCYRPEDMGQSETWVAVYILKDLELILIFVPFMVLWVIYLLIKYTIAKKILTLLLLAAAALYCLVALASGGGQDWQPHIGAYLSLLPFPLLLVITYWEFRKPTPDKP